MQAGTPGASRVPPQPEGRGIPRESLVTKGGADAVPQEAGGLTLEQSLELWERGERLAAVCGEWLDGARARLATAMARREDTDRADAEDDAPF